jgi:catechol 2,3-dioxygenase-like lactoylglutathione lyase family enzyme
MVKMKRAATLLLLALPAAAQLAPPNAAGVTMGHLHLNVADLDAARSFWLALGAQPGKLGPRIEVMKFPDVLVLLNRVDAAGAGSDGSTVGHLGFRVRNLAEWREKWKAAGLVMDRVADQAPTQLFLTAPGGVRVEISQDASLAVPITHHHVHFYTADVNRTKAWYVETFGAKPGRRGHFEAGDIPGANLTFDAAKAAPAPTKGRVLDHIGFEVRGLEAFCKKLEAAGVKFDVPYRKVPSLGISLAFLTDPWGTYIELTEGLDKL